ncbi:spore coat protein [Cohnella sp. 56]|uniref:spore coat protein n=1 Tax=Cohnella sp. 56 TaxID=3113722 RepID=UPI0030E9ECC4
MNLGTHEALELNELLMSCTNSIQSMALFLNQVQDAELREIISRQYQVHIQDYNMKVEFATKMTGSTERLEVPGLSMTALLPVAAPPYPSIEPKVKLAELDDRAIATSYLLTLKRAGREYAWAAFECGTPQLRAFLEDAFRMCSHQAHEVWSYMGRKGWYPISAAPSNLLQTMGQIYREVPHHQPMSVYQ